MQKLSKVPQDKIEAINNRESRFQATVEQMEDEAIWELTQILNLEEDVVRTIWYGCSEDELEII